MLLRRAIGLVALAELAYVVFLVVLFVLYAQAFPVNDPEAREVNVVEGAIGTGLLATVPVVLLSTLILMARCRPTTRRAILVERVTLAAFALLQLVLAVAGVMTFLTDRDPSTARRRCDRVGQSGCCGGGGTSLARACCFCG